jgi:hypothetical protein
MKRLAHVLRRFAASKAASVPLQYAMVLAGTAAATMVIVQTASNKIAEKFSVVTSALTKIQF